MIERPQRPLTLAGAALALLGTGGAAGCLTKPTQESTRSAALQAAKVECLHQGVGALGEVLRVAEEAEALLHMTYCTESRCMDDPIEEKQAACVELGPRLATAQLAGETALRDCEALPPDDEQTTRSDLEATFGEPDEGKKSGLAVIKRRIEEVCREVGRLFRIRARIRPSAGDPETEDE